MSIYSDNVSVLVGKKYSSPSSYPPWQRMEFSMQEHPSLHHGMDDFFFSSENSRIVSLIISNDNKRRIMTGICLVLVGVFLIDFVILFFLVFYINESDYLWFIGTAFGSIILAIPFAVKGNRLIAENKKLFKESFYIPLRRSYYNESPSLEHESDDYKVLVSLFLDRINPEEIPFLTKMKNMMSSRDGRIYSFKLFPYYSDFYVGQCRGCPFIFSEMSLAPDNRQSNSVTVDSGINDGLVTKPSLCVFSGQMLIIPINNFVSTLIRVSNDNMNPIPMEKINSDYRNVLIQYYRKLYKKNIEIVTGKQYYDESRNFVSDSIYRPLEKVITLADSEVDFFLFGPFAVIMLGNQYNLFEADSKIAKKGVDAVIEEVKNQFRWIDSLVMPFIEEGIAGRYDE